MQNHGYFPIMHVIAFREQVLRESSALAGATLAAFDEAWEVCRRRWDDPNWSWLACSRHGYEEERQKLGHVNQSVDPIDWDLSYSGATGSGRYGLALAYDSLLKFKQGPDLPFDQLILQPALAEHREIPDAQTFVFHLRQGVKFADLPPVNGREVAATDIKWTYEYWSRMGQFKDKNLPPGQFAWFFEGMTGIDTPDPSTATVRFQSPFLNYAAWYLNPIVAHEIFDLDGTFHNRLAGTGPYQLDVGASQKGSRWVWKRNPTYWDQGKPYIDQLNWLILADNSTAVAAFQTKQLDWLGGPGIITSASAQQIKQANPTAVLGEYPESGPLHLYLNIRVAPLNDLRVRRAISLGIDRDAFITSFGGSKGSWALAGAFPDTFTQAEIKQITPYDPAQAKQLLSAAGYANGLDLEFIYPGSTYGDSYLQTMQLLQAQLKKAGINLNLKTMDKQAYETNKRGHTYQITMTGKKIEVDVDSYLYAVFYPNAGANYGDVNDPQLTSLLVAQRQETDPNKRRATVREAVKRINVDETLALALYYPAGNLVWQSRIKNYAPNFGTFAWPLMDSWLAS